MKVIYDISIFGCVEKWPDTKAGTYRFVESLARALINSKQCSLTFTALENWLEYYAMRHLQSANIFQNVYFPHSRTHHQLFELVRKTDHQVWRSTGFEKMGWRGAGKLLRQSACLFNSNSIVEKNLRMADVFHSPYYSVPAMVKIQKKLKSFITVHDMIPIYCPQYFEIASVENFKRIADKIDRNDWVTCVSQHTKNDLCNYRKDLDPNRVFVTHLGAANWFHPCNDAAVIEKIRVKYKIPEGKYILSVCTLEPRKNLSHLIRSFSQLIRQERLQDLRLILVGGLGWKYESIFSELTGADEAIRERVILAGRVADEDMAALYSGAMAFVYPSFYEGFGLPPLEAMQCGTPVITSNTSSLPEVVGNAGLMVDPSDSDALCQAILRLVMDDELRETMSQKSLEQAGKFSWEQCANQTLAAYETAVNSRSCAGFHHEANTPEPLIAKFAE